MNTIRFAVLSLVGLLLSGCAARNHKHLPPPLASLETISLTKALEETIAALDNLYEEIEVKQKTTDRTHGLVPSEIEVVFQLAADSNKGADRKLSVALGPIAAESGWTSEVAHSRTNTITIRLRSILFAPGPAYPSAPLDLEAPPSSLLPRKG